MHLNKDWNKESGGKFAFQDVEGQSIKIPPPYNRYLLEGIKQDVKRVEVTCDIRYRYDITNRYWSE
ncbi:MAG: hypothetical protein ACRBBW_06800 [Cellvibrionaceae bacterium]